MATSHAYDLDGIAVKKDGESLKLHQIETGPGTGVTEELLSSEEDRRILRRVDLLFVTPSIHLLYI